MTTETNSPAFMLYRVDGNGPDARWTKIGAAWPNRDKPPGLSGFYFLASQRAKRASSPGRAGSTFGCVGIEAGGSPL